MTAKRGVVLLFLCAIWLPVHGQTPESTAIQVQLELTAEVATTTDDGYPSALRVTLRNVGGTAVDMPMNAGGCLPDRGLGVEAYWTPDDEQMGSGSGGACGSNNEESLMSRIKRQWIRLRPGEFITETLSLLSRYDPAKQGTVHYRAVYIPPFIAKQELEEARSAGYVIPTRWLSTEQQSFQIR